MDSKVLEGLGVDLSDPDALDNWQCDNVWEADKVEVSRAMVGDSEETTSL